MTYLATNGLLAVEKTLTDRLMAVRESVPDEHPPANLAPNPRKGVAPGRYSPGYGARRAAGTHREWGGGNPSAAKPHAAVPATRRFNAPIDFPSRRQTRAGRKAYNAAAPKVERRAAEAKLPGRFNAPLDFPSRREVRRGRKTYLAGAQREEKAVSEKAPKLKRRTWAGTTPIDLPSGRQVRAQRRALREVPEKAPKLQRRTFAGTTPIDLPSRRDVRAQRRAQRAAQTGPKPTKQPKAPKPTYPKISRQARRTWATTSTGAPVPKGPSMLQRIAARNKARSSAKAGPAPAPVPAPQRTAPSPRKAPPAKASGGFGSLSSGRKALLGGGALAAAAGAGHILGTRRVEKAMPENVPALRRERRALGRKTKAGLIAGGVLIPAAVAGGEIYRRRRQDVGKSELAYLGTVSKAAKQDNDNYARNVALAGGASYLGGSGLMSSGYRKTAAEIGRHGLEVSPAHLMANRGKHAEANLRYHGATGKNLPGTGRIAGGRLLRGAGGAGVLIGLGAAIGRNRQIGREQRSQRATKAAATRAASV